MPEYLQFLPFEEKNRELIKSLIKELYFSPAVIHKPNETIINSIVCACFDKKINVDGYEISATCEDVRPLYDVTLEEI